MHDASHTPFARGSGGKVGTATADPGRTGRRPRAAACRRARTAPVTDPRRRPDFIVIGAMKAGTSSLFQWLGTHPGCTLPPVKEPHFFSRDDRFAEGPDDYLALFAGAPPSTVTGEASASYADPRIAGTVARRMQELAPSVRLVYLVRDPVERLRSHYLHEWQRSRERRPVLEAVTAPDNPYVALSRYAETADRFSEVLGDDRLLVVPTPDLETADSPGWRRVTDHLGLPPHPGPAGRANVTAEKVAFNPLLLRLWEGGWLHRARRLPGPVRAAARRATRSATRDLREQTDLVRATELPDDLVAALRSEWDAVTRRVAP